MCVLVIGGAGYIGSHVVYELINDNYEVIILDNLSSGNKLAVNKKSVFYEGDVQDQKILTHIFTHHQINVVIHLAAKLLVGESVQKPLEYFANNIGGLISLLTVMNQFNVKRIVFSSTAAVYGKPMDEKPISEDDVKDPINPYGSSKLANEHLIIAAHQAYGINYVIFRFFNVAGANNEANIGQSVHKLPTHLIPTIMNAIDNPQLPLTIYGNDYSSKDGTCIRDYIHVIDVAKAHSLGVKYVNKGHSNIFNLGSNHGYSIKEVLDITEKTLSLKIPYKIGQRRPGDPTMLVAKTNKAKAILNFQPQFSLGEIIKSEFVWRKKHLF